MNGLKGFSEHKSRKREKQRKRVFIPLFNRLLIVLFGIPLKIIVFSLEQMVSKRMSFKIILRLLIGRFGWPAANRVRSTDNETECNKSGNKTKANVWDNNKQ